MGPPDAPSKNHPPVDDPLGGATLAAGRTAERTARKPLADVFGEGDSASGRGIETQSRHTEPGNRPLRPARGLRRPQSLPAALRADPDSKCDFGSIAIRGDALAGPVLSSGAGRVVASWTCTSGTRRGVTVDPVTRLRLRSVERRLFLPGHRGNQVLARPPRCGPAAPQRHQLADRGRTPRASRSGERASSVEPG